MLLTLTLTAGPGLASAFTRRLWELLALRLLVGVGVGGAPAALALYSEYLPSARRGQRILTFLLFFSVGSLFEALLAWSALLGALLCSDAALPHHTGHARALCARQSLQH